MAARRAARGSEPWLDEFTVPAEKSCLLEGSRGRIECLFEVQLAVLGAQGDRRIWVQLAGGWKAVSAAKVRGTGGKRRGPQPRGLCHPGGERGPVCILLCTGPGERNRCFTGKQSPALANRRVSGAWVSPVVLTQAWRIETIQLRIAKFIGGARPARPEIPLQKGVKHVRERATLCSEARLKCIPVLPKVE